MTGTDLLGTLAATCTTLAFVPQVLKTWRARSGEGVSTLMFAVLGVGVSLWVLYGLALDALPIVVANGTVLVLTLVMLLLKVAYRSKSVTDRPRAAGGE